MRRFLSITILLFASSHATAQQAVHQSGNVTPGHAAMWTTNGVIQDAGTAAIGGLTSLGVTASGAGICQNSGPTSGPFNRICLNATQTGGGFLSVDNNNGATGGISFLLNGATQPILTANLPVLTGHAACFFNTTGTIQDCGFVPLTGTGWTPNLPLIGSAPGGVTQGTLSGNTTRLVTLSGSTTVGNCAKWDASGNLVDLGSVCVTGGPFLALAGGTMTGTIIGADGATWSASGISGLASPTLSSQAATKQYVDSTAVGLTVHTPVALATIGALPANTYNNGTGGVGATLTANANGALSVDSTSVSASQRILVKNEASAANNGIYTVTQTGDAGTPYILTRTADANTAGTQDPNKIGFGTYVLVSAGSTLINSAWTVNSTVSTIGTSAINWAEFSGPSTGTVQSLGGQTGVLGLDSTLHFTGSNLGLNLATANTWTGKITVNNAGFALTGNQSAAAWTTSGIRYVDSGGTLTDTTSSGTVAAAYTSVHGGNTIAASSAATYTNYYNTYFKNETAGTNVTLTNVWALGADSARIAGNLAVTGTITAPGSTTNIVRNASGVLSADNGFIYDGTNVGLGTTAPSGVDVNASVFLTVNNPTAHARGEIAVGGNGSTIGDAVGNIEFYNSSLGTAEKRLAAIFATSAGALNNGSMSLGAFNSAGVYNFAITIQPNQIAAFSLSNGPVQYNCTGTDTTALNTIIGSGIRSLQINGTCGVTTLNALPTNFSLSGGNWQNDCIQTSSATGNVLTLASGDVLSDLCLSSSVTRTAGDLIKIGSGTPGSSANVTIHHVSANSVAFFNGIEICGAQFVHMDDIILVASGASANAGILVDCASGSTQPLNTEIAVINAVITHVTAGAGIEIKAAGDVSIMRLQSDNNTYGILIDPTGAASLGNTIQYFACAVCILDTNTSVGMLVHPINGATTWKILLNNSWIASNSLWGVGLETDSGNGSSINAVNLDSDIIAGNAFYGIVLNDNSAVYNTMISNDQIADNGVGNSGGGIYIGVGSSVFHVGSNNRIGSSGNFPANNNSIHCGGAGATFAESFVTFNDMTGNTSTCGGFTFSVTTGNINFP